MEVTITNGDATVVKVVGRLDTVNAAKFGEEIAPIISGNMQKVVLDFSEFEYISSSGLRQLLALQKAMNAREGGELVIKSVSPHVMEVFTLSGFASLFKIE